jgi:hypothetical protein
LHHGCRLSNTAFPLYGIIGSTSRRLDGAAGMMLGVFAYPPAGVYFSNTTL